MINTLLILQSGAMVWLWDYTETLVAKVGFTPDYEIVRSIAFILIAQLYSMILHTPFSLYGTFVIGNNEFYPFLFIQDSVKLTPIFRGKIWFQQTNTFSKKLNKHNISYFFFL
jgi:hypothetical protein